MPRLSTTYGFVTDIEEETAPRGLTEDTISIFMDGNSAKPLCRVYIFDEPWQLGLFDGSRVRPGGMFRETLFTIEDVEDIFMYGEQIQETTKRWGSRAAPGLPTLHSARRTLRIDC